MIILAAFAEERSVRYPRGRPAAIPKNRAAMKAALSEFVGTHHHFFSSEKGIVDSLAPFWRRGQGNTGVTAT
jgi:hypothetical protein